MLKRAKLTERHSTRAGTAANSRDRHHKSANTQTVTTEQEIDRVRLAEALLRIGDEDQDSFRIVYSLTCNKLFGICLRICGEQSAAEDVLAGVYVTIWKRAGAWDPGRGSAISWLATIARNGAIDWRRSRTSSGIEATGNIFDLNDTPNAEANLLSAENDDQIHGYLEAVMTEQRAAIRAAFFGGLTYAELALQSGIPLETMKCRVRHGLLKMRHDLQIADRDVEPTFTIAHATTTPPTTALSVSNNGVPA